MKKKKLAKKSIVVTGAGAETTARVIKSRLSASGKSTRVRGHVSARTRRRQAKRDSKNLPPSS